VAEQLRARFVELAPDGFEEVEGPEGVQLAAYGDAAERVRAAFPEAELVVVEAGWEERWREFHRPVRVGPLWIGPPWESAPNDATSVVIDPGRAFGTGAHATTRLCLSLMLELPRGSALDVGCGSGVLAICAARLGFGPVSALDIDEIAVDAARTNAAANGVSIDVRRFDALAVDAVLPATDLVLANLTLDAVEALAPLVDAERLAASGYLARETPSLAGWATIDRRELDGWAADLLMRK
jgi:ribosomal protein L11 methyltransferase